MSVIEWFLIGVIILFFAIPMIYSWADLIKDKRYYKEKTKNVSHIDGHRNRKRKVKK